MINLIEDNELLNMMIEAVSSQALIYAPGGYWLLKTKNILKEIKRAGIQNFRGSESLVGMSYTDALVLDMRLFYRYDFTKNIVRSILSIFPFNSIFSSQVNLTTDFANQCNVYATEILKFKPRSQHLLSQYTVKDSTNAGCLSKVKINNEEISLHYMYLLDQHDYLAAKIDFKKVKSVFEIGGGFGANVHLILENHKNVKKIIYLDIPPNLYIGTQYLKSLYGKSVFDYRDIQKNKEIEFSNNDELEIFCITPWQIENIKSPVDLFTNMHSFVEMPEEIVKNYIKKFEELPNAENSSVALFTYDEYNADSTIIHTKLPEYFKNRKFEHFEHEMLFNSNRKNYFFLSNKQ